MPGYGDGRRRGHRLGGARAHRSTSGFRPRGSDRLGPARRSPSRCTRDCKLPGSSDEGGTMSETRRGTTSAPKGSDATRARRRRPRPLPHRPAQPARGGGRPRRRGGRKTARGHRLVRELAPDVVVMDLNMPGMGGVEATRQITSDRAAHARRRADDLGPGRRRRHGRDPGRRLRIPAEGRVDPGADRRDPRGRAVASRSISPQIAAQGAAARPRARGAPDAAETIRAELSDRELEVLKLIANGKDNARSPRELLHQPEDGQEPHLEHPDEAPDREPHPGGGLRGPQRDRLAAAAAAVSRRARRRRRA